MRILVFLLVAANLLFLAWAQGFFGTPVNPDALRVSRQLQPERLTIVARDQPPPLPVKPEPSAVKPAPPVVKPEPVAPKPEPLPATPEPLAMEATPPAVEPEPAAATPPEAPTPADRGENGAGNGGNEVSSAVGTPPICLLLADLPPADAEAFEAVLTDRFETFKVQRTVTTAASSYWINIPPLPTMQEAEAKVAELRNLGVVEYFIVRESGPNNLAISLGLYSRRPAAEAHFETLRGKGVKSARITERNVHPVSVTLAIDGPAAEAEALRQAIADNLPENTPVPCDLAAAAAATGQ